MAIFNKKFFNDGKWELEKETKPTLPIDPSTCDHSETKLSEGGSLIVCAKCGKIMGKPQRPEEDDDEIYNPNN